MSCWNVDCQKKGTFRGIWGKVWQQQGAVCLSCVPYSLSKSMSGRDTGRIFASWLFFFLLPSNKPVSELLLGYTSLLLLSGRWPFFASTTNFFICLVIVVSDWGHVLWQKGDSWVLLYHLKLLFFCVCVFNTSLSRWLKRPVMKEMSTLFETASFSSRLPIWSQACGFYLCEVVWESKNGEKCCN